MGAQSSRPLSREEINEWIDNLDLDTLTDALRANYPKTAEALQEEAYLRIPGITREQKIANEVRAELLYTEPTLGDQIRRQRREFDERGTYKYEPRQRELAPWQKDKISREFMKKKSLYTVD